MIGKRIMIVDDAECIRMILALEVEQAGFDVVAQVESCEEAVKLYPTVKPDIVTMDIVTPGMDGIEAVKKIISLDHKAKVIMLSSMGVGNKVQDAIQAGAKGFVVKPYSTERLIEVLNKTLASKG